MKRFAPALAVFTCLAAALPVYGDDLRTFDGFTPFQLPEASGAEPPIEVQRGATEWPTFADGSSHASTLFRLGGVVDATSAADVIQALQTEAFQTDLDSVDGAATHQYWLYAYNRRQYEPSKARDFVNRTLGAILETRITPIVRALYPRAEELQPCFSFIRRYKDTERTRHPTHFDVQSHTTFIVSLNNFGDDYSGGIYVATGDRVQDRRYLSLKAGDGAVHQSDLLHGVHVPSGTRWSWVVWFAPGRCDADSTEWHRSQADTQDPAAASPLHQFLLARRLQAKLEDQGRNADDARASAEPWLRRAAEAGFARAQNEYGEALRQSGDNAGAAEWLEKAADREPAARYNLGLVRLAEGNDEAAVSLFDSACRDGSPDACFNMAVAHSGGKGGLDRDTAAALDILRRTDTPEAMLFASELSDSDQDLERASVLGSPEAQYRLARKLLSGGQQRREEGLRYLERAARNGHRGSQQTIAALKRAKAKRPTQGYGDL